MALTTTTGFCGRRPSTMEATRSMAFASSTEVPPNFITIMSETSCGKWLEEAEADPSIAARGGGWDARATAAPTAALHARRHCSSSQVALGFEQFSIEDCGAGGSANRVVRKHGEFPVEHAAWTKTSDCGRHASAQVDVEAGLGTIDGFQIDDRAFGSAG